jgi:rubrerythrin
MSEKKMILKLLDEAMVVEKKGAQLYKDLAGKASDPEVKRLFNRLAEDELEHFNFVKRLKAFAVTSTNWEFEDLDVIKNLGLFTVVEFPEIDPFLDIDFKNLPEKAEIFDALKSCFEAEKLQYNAYKNLSEQFEESEAEKILVHLANEERRHALELAEEHNRLIRKKKK